VDDLDLPPGQFVWSEEGDGPPAYWLSDGPADHALWTRLLADHGRSGYWPLLLSAGDDEDYPWTASRVRRTSPGDYDVPALLRVWWQHTTERAEADLAPFGADWPAGPAPAPPYRLDPDERASGIAFTFLEECPEARLGLVAAASGADALTAMGWQGPARQGRDTPQIAAVVRDWERRYGVRVVALDSTSTLIMSVAGLPDDDAQAFRTAAEHTAFCPDIIWNGVPGRNTITTYADYLLGAPVWVFWWD
jgi:hypothetical protein